jgi:hypothetical protein
VNRESCAPQRNLGGQIGGSRRPKKRARLFNKNFDLRRSRERSGEKPLKIANGQKFTVDADRKDFFGSVRYENC